MPMPDSAEPISDCGADSPLGGKSNCIWDTCWSKLGRVEAASEAYLKAGHTGWLLTLEESDIRTLRTLTTLLIRMNDQQNLGCSGWSLPSSGPES